MVIRFASSRSGQTWPYFVGVLAYAAVSHLGLGSEALKQVGLSDWQASLILLAMVACRAIARPVYVVRGGGQRLQRLPAAVQRALLRLRSPFAEETTIALSMGGVLIPLAVSVYIMVRNAPNALELFNTTILVAGIVELVRLALLRVQVVRPPGWLAPVVALLLGWTLQAEHRSAVVYVSSLVAVLTTVDLPGLNDLQAIGAAEIVIGGEASFAAIFMGCALSLLFT